MPQRIKHRLRHLHADLLGKGALRPPIDAEFAYWSIISSSNDQRPPASSRLLDLALTAASAARNVDLSAVAARAHPDAHFAHFPGEHYPLLAALAELERPAVAIEIGTFTGIGALTLRSHLPPESRLVTFDILEWPTIPNTLLRASDFDDRFEQRIGDLSERSYFESQLALLDSARLIFVDGPKDGRFEPTFLAWLLPRLAGTGALVVLDDIRLLTMVELWRSLPFPKLDVTTFGHWTGTGFVDLS